MNTLAALDLLLALLSRASLVSQMIATAQQQGRTELTKAEIDQLVSADDAARANLVIAIENAKAAGR